MASSKYRLSKVKEVLDYYMQNKGLYCESWQDLDYMTKTFNEVMGNKHLHELTPDHFVAYISGRRRGTFGARPAKSDGTIRRELTHLRTAINYCLRVRLVNPEHDPLIDMPAAPPPRDRWLSKKELQKIMLSSDLVDNRARVFVWIARYTAARKSAIENLKWDQVNFDTHMIEFGKHDKKTTKKRKPTVPMTADLERELLAEKNDQIAAGTLNEYVLGTNADIRAPLDVIAKHAGIHGVTPHVFRHTWASHASMAGIPMQNIARVLGDKVATVEKTYAKFAPDYLRDTVERATA